ncbi:hypothetical protein [Bacillus sp. FJAT-53711]|uniref:hypothetical protein n=1 Tax=Bacillus yunxiaonensis TaxID=3127665 RepID=UPI00301352FB
MNWIIGHNFTSFSRNGWIEKDANIHNVNKQEKEKVNNEEAAVPPHYLHIFRFVE